MFLTIPLEESGEQRVGDSTATPPVAEPSAVYASTHCSGGDRDDGDGGDGESSSAIAGAGGAGTACAWLIAPASPRFARMQPSMWWASASFGSAFVAAS